MQFPLPFTTFQNLLLFLNISWKKSGLYFNFVADCLFVMWKVFFYVTSDVYVSINLRNMFTVFSFESMVKLFLVMGFTKCCVICLSLVHFKIHFVNMSVKTPPTAAACGSRKIKRVSCFLYVLLCLMMIYFQTKTLPLFL